MMDPAGDQVPWPQIRSFLEGLSGFARMRLALVSPSAEGLRELGAWGDNPLCESLRANPVGALLCADSRQRAVQEASGREAPLFDLCHARLGLLAVPIPGGGDGVSVCACGALLHGLSVEHEEYLLGMGRELRMDNARSLVSAAAELPGFSRSGLARLGEFIHQQLEEKMSASGSLEAADDLFFRKYEELMSLYAISENLSPEAGYGRVLAVILDKGMQKLAARSGLVLLSDPDHGGLRAAAVFGPPLLPEAGECPPVLARILCSLEEPTLLEAGPEEGLAAPVPLRLLAYPFQVKGPRGGFLVFAPLRADRLEEGQSRFLAALANQASTVLYNALLYREISDLLFSTLEALSTAIDAKDPYTRGHSGRVAEYAVRAAQVMGFGPKLLTRIKVAGLLHDFGKVLVAPQVLGKSSTLSLGEKDAMERHPAVGAKILGKFRAFADIVPGVRHHHERWDGQGYPDGLAGDAIPLIGRIIAVADAFDAMVTSRPYRARVKPEEALGEILRNAGVQFDPEVVEAFVRALRAWGGEGTEAAGPGERDDGPG